MRVRPAIVPLLSIFFLVYLYAIAGAEVAGGSNYGWFALQKCERDPFSIIPNMDAKFDTVSSQLSAMFHNGQRRLRIPIFFSEKPLIGYLVVGNEGVSVSDQRKIEKLFSTIKEIGFDGIVISFFPQGSNLASSGIFNSSNTDVNFLVISQVRDIARRTHLSYLIDLQNEGIAAPNQHELLDYATKLWIRYCAKFGSDDTLGFSLIPEAGRIASLNAIYGANAPKIMDLHIYVNPYESLVSALSTMKRMGLTSFSLIVGETYYNDDSELSKIRAAAKVSGIKLLFITQWPQSQIALCDNVSVIPLNAPKSLVEPPVE